MITNLSYRALATSLLSPLTLVLALSSSDIPIDTPISSLIASANQHLARGETNNALTYYDVAISRDPSNYLTYFRRGATYLSMGKNSQASADFDKVLYLKPGFEGALVQRAKIKARNGDWEAAKIDFVAHGNSAKDLAELERAKASSLLATEAERKGKWEDCISHATKAIVVASKMSSLRETRAQCRLELGELQEGINDLKHVLQMQPGTIEPHMKISAISFYGLSSTENGIEQLRKCLHSDPDSKKCKELYRREKTLEKKIDLVKTNLKRDQFVTAQRTLLSSGGEVGLVQDIKNDIKELQEGKIIVGKSPNKLLALVLGMTCESYFKQDNLKKALQWCDEAKMYDKDCFYCLLSQARQKMNAELFEEAIHILSDLAEHHPDSEEVHHMLDDAETELKRSKTKDYYKVLGVSRDADPLQIKSAYRRLTKIYHPDKAHKQGFTKEEAEKKMAAINEAYEVLSNPELKERYDHGDDPNNHEQHHYPFERPGRHQSPGFMSSQFHSQFGGGNMKFAFQGQEFFFN